MTQTNHTPGPWEIDDAAFDGLDIVSPQGRVAMLNDGEPGEDTSIWANARLIAAAPDMLAALEALMRWETSALDAEQAAALMDEVCDMARAAIAKAKGE